MTKQKWIKSLLSAITLSVLLLAPDAFSADKNTESSPMEVIVCNPLLQQLGMASTWDAAKAVGVKAMEISVKSEDLSCASFFVGQEKPYRLDSIENAKKLRKDAQANGIRIPVLCSRIQLDAQTTTAPELSKKLIEIAPHVGAGLIYFPIVTDSYTKTTIDDDLFVKNSIAILNDLVKHGEKYNVDIAIENLSVYWNRPEVTRRVLKAFTPEQFNLCLDPTNLYWYGHPRSKIYDIVNEFMPRTKHFHAKNVAHPPEKIDTVRPVGWEYGKNSVPVAKGDINFKTIIPQLYKSGYRGYVSIEDDSLGHYPQEQRASILRQDVRYLQGIIKQL